MPLIRIFERSENENKLVSGRSHVLCYLPLNIPGVMVSKPWCRSERRSLILFADMCE